MRNAGRLDLCGGQHRRVQGARQDVRGDCGEGHCASARGDCDRAFGRFDASCGEQRACDHRIADRQRHSMAAEQGDQWRGVLQRKPCPARFFGNEGIEETGFDKGIPHRAAVVALLDLADRGGGADIFDQASEGIDQFGHVHEVAPFSAGQGRGR